MSVCSKHKHYYVQSHALDVPRFPTSVNQLYFYGSNFNVIDKALLVNISGLFLNKLSFYNTSTVRVGVDAFDDMHVTNLRICDNENLDPRNISLDSFVGNRKKSIHLDGNNFVNIPHTLFQSLRTQKIRVLSLARNLLTSIDFRVLGNISVGILDLSYNLLRELFGDRQRQRDVYILKLYNNRFSKIPSFCSERQIPIFPNLTKLYIDNNRIYDNVGLNSLKCLETLTSLRMGYNFIQRIYDYSFTNLTCLKDLSLMKLNNFNEVNLDPNSFYGLSQLTTLKLMSNKIQFDMLTTPELFSMFSNMSHLYKLSLEDNRLQHDRRANITSILQSMTKLQYLNLVGCGIRDISDIAFPGTLKCLRLSRNIISYWNNGTELFGHLNDLQYLSIDINNINFINESSIPFSLMYSLKTINLGNNPMSCTCAQRWFMNWLRTTDLHVLGTKKHYRCFSPLAYHGTFLKDYDPGFIQCLPVYVIISSTIVIVCVTITLIGSILYLRRWDIKYCIFRMTTTYVPLENDGFEYNAYVSYEDDDRAFVHEQLCEKIPNICIRLRDFLLAEDIMQNVETHVEASKKVILVLSNNYFNSHWQVAELNFIHSVSVKRRKYICVVIILDDFDKKFLSAICRGFLRDSPCLQWTDNKKGQKLFWRRLEYELSKPAKRYSHI